MYHGYTDICFVLFFLNIDNIWTVSYSNSYIDVILGNLSQIIHSSVLIIVFKKNILNVTLKNTVTNLN